MRKRHLLSWFLDDLLDYLLIILSVILLLVGLAHFIYTFYLYEQAEARHLTIGPSWWLERIERTILPLAFALWLALSWYKGRLRKKLETIKHAIQMRKIVYVFWWFTVLILVLAAVRFFAIFYHGSDKLVFNLITLSLIVFLLVHTLVTSRAELRYCLEQPLCNIAAAGLLEKGNKFLHTHDFDKAHDAFLKACETAPEGIFLWCQLAYFCELFRNNTTESDNYMAKAKELISTKKAKSNSDKACYLNYLGMILYKRGEYDKGLEYMKQSIDIEPRQGRISMYEEKLSEFKAKQQNTKLQYGSEDNA